MYVKTSSESIKASTNEATAHVQYTRKVKTKTKKSRESEETIHEFQCVEKTILCPVPELPPMQRWAYTFKNVVTSDKSHFPNFRYGSTERKSSKIMGDQIFYQLFLELITIEHLEGKSFFENRFKKKNDTGDVSLVSSMKSLSENSIQRKCVPKDESEWRKGLDDLDLKKMNPSKNILKAVAHAFNQPHAIHDIHERLIKLTIIKMV